MTYVSSEVQTIVVNDCWVFLILFECNANRPIIVLSINHLSQNQKPELKMRECAEVGIVLRTNTLIFNGSNRES